MAEKIFELDQIEDIDVQKHEEEVESSIEIGSLISGRTGNLFTLYAESEIKLNTAKRYLKRVKPILY